MEFYIAMINKYNADIHYTINNKSNVQKYINYIKSPRKMSKGWMMTNPLQQTNRPSIVKKQLP